MHLGDMHVVDTDREPGRPKKTEKKMTFSPKLSKDPKYSPSDNDSGDVHMDDGTAEAEK